MSYSMSAQIIGDKELKAAFEAAPKVVAKELSNAIEKTTREAAAKARGYAPWQHGDLKRSIETNGPVITQNNIYARVSTDKNYARYQEEGTGVYGPKGTPITPKKGKILAWKSGGQWVFARQVKGVRPKWYMKRAKEEIAPKLTDSVREAMARIISFIARGK